MRRNRGIAIEMIRKYRARSSNAFFRCTPLSGVHLHFREYFKIKTDQADDAPNKAETSSMASRAIEFLEPAGPNSPELEQRNPCFEHIRMGSRLA